MLHVLEREIIAEEFDNRLPRVVEMIANEVDDEGEREQQQQKTGWSVDRPGRPTCTACTGSEDGRPVGRPQSLTVSAQLSIGHPVGRPVDW